MLKNLISTLQANLPRSHVITHVSNIKCSVGGGFISGRLTLLTDEGVNRGYAFEMLEDGSNTSLYEVDLSKG